MIAEQKAEGNAGDSHPDNKVKNSCFQSAQEADPRQAEEANEKWLTSQLMLEKVASAKGPPLSAVRIINDEPGFVHC